MSKKLIGNKVTESDVRAWLTNQGYNGRSAKLRELELHAIQRPGWVQVFRFHMRVNVPNREADDPVNESGSDWIDVYGIVRDDERDRNQQRKTQVLIFPDIEQRDRQLEQLSEGLLTRKTGQNGSLGWLIAVGMIMLLAWVAATELLGL